MYYVYTASVALSERHLAEQFESYLKSGSGCAFAKRHLVGADHT